MSVHDPDLELAIPLPILDPRWARTPDEYLLPDYGEASGVAPTSLNEGVRAGVFEPPARTPIFEPMTPSRRALLWLWIATVLGLCAFWSAVVVLVT